MCNLSQPQVPRGWQRVCQKAKMPLESRDPCSLFLSPNGKTFKTMDEVHRYSKVLHLEKLAREQKKMEAKNLKLDTSGVLKRKVGDSTELACTRCEKSFVNMVMVKKHYKEAHIGEKQTLEAKSGEEKQEKKAEQSTTLISAEQKLAQEKANLQETLSINKEVLNGMLAKTLTNEEDILGQLQEESDMLVGEI